MWYWHIASFKEKFQKAGDYLTTDIFGWPYFLIVDKDGNIVSDLPARKMRLQSNSQRERILSTMFAVTADIQLLQRIQVQLLS
jgi:hypothetical protein